MARQQGWFALILALAIAAGALVATYGLQLGLDLLMFPGGGKTFERDAGRLLGTTYALLRRRAFAAVLKAHLQKRDRPRLSTLC